MFTKETLETISKYGFATVAAVAVSWAFYQFNIVPSNEERNDAREERKAMNKALVESSKEVSKTNQAQSETNKSLAESYAKMTTSNEATVQILREIRDDQKKFPAVREADQKPEP
jgi:hypothetical protein